ncbi:hypothetical protein Tco_1216805 [Tanacetum coccineum]
MGDKNPIRTLGDYSKPSHEGYRNTIELLEGNNVVPFRSDTIWLVQNGCSFHGLRSEDPNQHLKEFLKLVDSLDLNGEYRERTRLRLFQFSLRDQARNWLERLPAGSIFTWEDLTTLPHHGIDLWLQVQIFYDHVNPVTRRTIDQSAGGKLCDRNAKESWALLEDLALYDNESWNDPRDFVQCLIEAHLAPKKPIQVNKIPSSCKICCGPYDTQYCIENPEQAFIDHSSSRLVSNFMASQDTILSKFEADFKQQQSEMTNKIHTVLKAITDRITGALPSDMVKNPKLNVNSTSLVLSACSYPTEDPQCSTRIHSSINAIIIYPKRPVKFQNNKPEEEEQE